MTSRLRARPTNMLDNCSVLLGRIAVQSIRCGQLLLTMFRGLCVHARTQAVGISWRHVFTYKPATYMYLSTACDVARLQNAFSCVG